jgi:hypothetical protein
MLFDVLPDRFRHEPRDRLSPGTPLANLRGRDGRRRRLDEHDHRIEMADRVERRPDHPLGKIRQAMRKIADGVAGSGDDREMRVLQDVRVVLPALNLGERVGADDEEQLRDGPSGSDRTSRP